MTGHDWILGTDPRPGSTNVSQGTPISIRFAMPVNRHSLNARNILVLDGCKGGKLISEQFAFQYSPETNTLRIYFKEQGCCFEGQNDVEVILTDRITNARNEKMGTPYQFRFTTAGTAPPECSEA